MNIKPSFYQSPDKDWWSGRTDSESDRSQFRYHQIVECVSLHELKEGEETVLLGFASDEGVRRNGGRIGASRGPEAFRKAIGSLCWQDETKGFADAGNILPNDAELEMAQELLSDTIEYLLEIHKKPFVIGGGHETAFGHYLGVARYLKEHHHHRKLGILNIDAHFDLRPHNGRAHSGSPFLQAHEHAANHGIDLKYMVYGINPHNNTQSLFEQADALGTRWVENRKVMDEETEALKEIGAFIEERDMIYLTVCLDVFDSAIAPGVSAPAWNGIRLNHALKVLDLAKSSGKLVTMDVCELNPEYDRDGRTAKLAGTLFSEFIR